LNFNKNLNMKKEKNELIKEAINLKEVPSKIKDSKNLGYKSLYSSLDKNQNLMIHENESRGDLRNVDQDKYLPNQDVLKEYKDKDKDANQNLEVLEEDVEKDVNIENKSNINPEPNLSKEYDNENDNDKGRDEKIIKLKRNEAEEKESDEIENFVVDTASIDEIFSKSSSSSRQGSSKNLLEKELEEGELKKFNIEFNDQVDKMFADYMNKLNIEVDLKKIERGQYIFGSKKIMAKIKNGNLIIRVGGGYMMIDEFLSAYTTQELAKIKLNEKIEASIFK